MGRIQALPVPVLKELLRPTGKRKQGIINLRSSSNVTCQISESRGLGIVRRSQSNPRDEPYHVVIFFAIMVAAWMFFLLWQSYIPQPAYSMYIMQDAFWEGGLPIRPVTRYDSCRKGWVSNLIGRSLSVFNFFDFTKCPETNRSPKRNGPESALLSCHLTTLT